MVAPSRGRQAPGSNGSQWRSVEGIRVCSGHQVATGANGDLWKGSGSGQGRDVNQPTSFGGGSGSSCWKASKPKHDRQHPAPGLL